MNKKKKDRGYFYMHENRGKIEVIIIHINKKRKDRGYYYTHE